eukprot:CAMPEP_0170458878 /NCGR_PEP_ID=MMETSP0123-20130129/5718_1 /TAXON_ID=182087 /ORGANISM="Favella ehrenbergii, Strain Fehren 1" /LENGTH=159 /DNA_ID=CAMNT_0010723207 /DNA_START=499 /DNA_END=974 /DNA_ORIENTATION=+
MSNRAEAPQQIEERTRNQLLVITDISTGGGIFFTCIDHSDPFRTFIETQVEQNQANSTACSSLEGVSTNDRDELNSTCTTNTTDINLDIGGSSDTCELRVEGNLFENNTAESTDIVEKEKDQRSPGNNLFFTSKQPLDLDGDVIDCTIYENWIDSLCDG